MGKTVTQHIESESDSNELISPPINSPFGEDRSNSNSVISPTSPFSFSNLTSSPITSYIPTPASPAGLSILLALETSSFEAKNIVFSPYLKIKNVVPIPETPENYSVPTPLMYGPLSAQEIMLSEEYTCVKIYGPNPRVIHIFRDYILESFPFVDCVPIRPNPPQTVANPYLGFTSGSYLKNCHMCKRLVHLMENHIYRYREMSFCSVECREYEMWLERHRKKMMKRAKKSSKRTSRDSAAATSTSEEVFFFIGDEPKSESW